MQARGRWQRAEGCKYLGSIRKPRVLKVGGPEKAFHAPTGPVLRKLIPPITFKMRSMRAKWGVGGIYQPVRDITGNICGIITYHNTLLLSGTYLLAGVA